MTEPKIKLINKLPWPEKVEKVEIQCVGEGFLSWTVSKNIPEETKLLWLQEALEKRAQASEKGSISESDDGTGSNEAEEKKKKLKKQVNLFDLDEDELKQMSHYDILHVPMTADSAAIKKSYHKACLKYHPDKTGRSEEDVVFLAVKAAYDTLSDGEKRRSYDSTVDFDDSIPAGDEPAKKFYSVYRPVFERNLRFAVREKTINNKKGKSKSTVPNVDNPLEGVISCPPFGDDNTPIEQVTAFYEYWTHFNSWRDFSLKAQEITKHDIDMADNRDEKRWMAKEIDRKAKNLKKQEVARIALLVERAMAADPRLKRQREEERIAKENAKREKEERERKQQQEQKEKEERERKEAEKREEALKEKRAKEKAIQQKQKKELRKTRQLLRRILFKAYEIDHANCENDEDSEPLWGSLEKMNDDVEFLCEKMTIDQMTELSTKLGGGSGEVPETFPNDMVDIIEENIQTIKGASQEEKEKQRAKRDEARKRLAEKEARKKAEIAAANPWSKEELSTLAKAVKKYPAGGANRWETICLFINNTLSLEQPRTKEECIAQYNETVRAMSAAREGSSTTTAGATAAAGSSERTDDGWTNELDSKLQEGLKKYPASMDKNERWSAIAKHVGKSKKECVQRFKTIREALKNKK